MFTIYLQKMFPMRKRFFSLLVILILLSSCKNNTQISEHFVYQYNKVAKNIKNSLIYTTYAKLYSEKIPKEYVIDVIVELTIKKAEYKNSLGTKILTKEIATLLTDEDVESLINSGGIITLKYKTFDNYFVEEIVLDQNALDVIKNLTNHNAIKPLTLNQLELNRYLNKINYSLPYLNEEDGSKILKFELDEWNNINCYVEYDGDYSSFSKFYFSKRMEKNKHIASIIANKGKFGIISITYKFQTSAGEPIEEYLYKPQ